MPDGPARRRAARRPLGRAPDRPRHLLGLGATATGRRRPRRSGSRRPWAAPSSALARVPRDGRPARARHHDRRSGRRRQPDPPRPRHRMGSVARDRSAKPPRCRAREVGGAVELRERSSAHPRRATRGPRFGGALARGANRLFGDSPEIRLGKCLMRGVMMPQRPTPPPALFETLVTMRTGFRAMMICDALRRTCGSE